MDIKPSYQIPSSQLRSQAKPYFPSPSSLHPSSIRPITFGLIILVLVALVYGSLIKLHCNLTYLVSDRSLWEYAQAKSRNNTASAD
jgi:hypothetical protein